MAAATSRPDHPDQSPQHRPLFGPGAGPGGRPGGGTGRRHRPAPPLPGGRGDLRAGRDHGPQSPGQGTAPGGKAQPPLGLAQPRCGRGDQRARRRRHGGQAPGSFPGVVPPAGSAQSADQGWGSRGSGTGPGPAGSGTETGAAAARRRAAPGLQGRQPGGRTAAPPGRHWPAASQPSGSPSRPGLHRQPRPPLAGCSWPAAGPARQVAHRSQPPGSEPSRGVCQWGLRRHRRPAQAPIRRLGRALRPDPGQEPDQGRFESPPALLAPPTLGPAAARRWRQPGAPPRGRGLLGALGPGAQPLAVALEAVPGSALHGPLQQPQGHGWGPPNPDGLPWVCGQTGRRPLAGRPGPQWAGRRDAWQRRGRCRDRPGRPGQPAAAERRWLPGPGERPLAQRQNHHLACLQRYLGLRRPGANSAGGGDPAPTGSFPADQPAQRNPGRNRVGA